MLRKVHGVKRGGRIWEVRIPDNSAAEIALEIRQIQTGASTLAEREELVSRLRGFLERNLSPTDLEIFSMRVLDRLEDPEIVDEFVRRAEGSDRAGDYQRILAALDTRSQESHKSGNGDGKDVKTRRSDAIRKRFTCAVGKLTGAIVAEFPELLEALPGLKSEKARL
jgi:hypothetical protein